MPDPHKMDSEKSVYLDNEEHHHRGNLGAKRVVLYTYDATSDTLQPFTSAVIVPTTLLSFVTPVVTAGTRVQLASNAVTNGFILQAPSTNTGLIYIGGSTVSATVYGAELQPGQSTSVMISNTNAIYIDSSVSGDKCAVIGS